MAEQHPDVDAYFKNAVKWKPELEKLRAIAISSGLKEELKWRQPCYTFLGRNVVIISVFKSYCAFNFLKGALMKDPDKMLTAPTENVQSGRQIRFANLEEIQKNEKILTKYLQEAIAVEKSGVKIKMKSTEDFPYCPEILEKFENDPDFHQAFKKLTQGRQRGYLLHFSSPKLAETRKNRIERAVEKIYAGKGLNDYR